MIQPPYFLSLPSLEPLGLLRVAPFLILNKHIANMVSRFL